MLTDSVNGTGTYVEFCLAEGLDLELTGYVLRNGSRSVDTFLGGGECDVE